MKDSKGMSSGPISEGKDVPRVFKGISAEHEHGVAMNPGFEHTKAQFTGRTHGKHKAWKREAPPKTP